MTAVWARRAPLLVALILTLLVFGPAMWQGTSIFFGREYVDAWGTQWFYWYVGHQFEASRGLGHTDLLFFPWGKDVYLHTGGNVLDAALAWPLRWVLGPIAGYNVWILALLGSNALAMRSLARAFVRQDAARPPLGGALPGGALPGSELLAADLAAVLFAFNPYVLHEIRDGRPTQALLVFFLLFWKDYLALGEDPRPMRAARAGLWLALTGLTYWFYALFAGIAAALVALVRLVGAGRAGGARSVAVHALAGAVAAVLVAPFAFPMLSATEVPGLLDVAKWSWSEWSPVTTEGMKIGVYVLDPKTLTSGFYALRKDGGLQFIAEDRNVLFAQIALILGGLFAAPRRHRFAVGVLLAVALVVAVGPSVDLGTPVPNVAYVALVRAFRVFQRLWWPSRALVLAEVAGGLFTAWALAFVLRRLLPDGAPRAFGALAVVAGLTAAWGIELKAAKLVPFPIWPSGIPAGYRCLAGADTSDGAGAVLELPYAHSQAHLYYQTVHGLPIFGGMVEDNKVFSPPEQVAIQSENSFLAVLLDQSTEAEKPPTYTDADRAALGALGYRYVLVDKRAYLDPGHEEARVGTTHEGRLRYVRRTLTTLLGAPVFEDQMTVIYAPWGAASPCPGETVSGS